MGTEVLIKVFTKRKTYEFYPETFEKKKLTIGGDIDNDVWIPELEDSRYLVTAQSGDYNIEKIDLDEVVLEKVTTLTRTSPHISLGNGDIHMVALFLDSKITTEYYSLLEVNSNSINPPRIGEITIGASERNNGFLSKISRITDTLERGHIYAVSETLPLLSRKHAIIYFNDFGEFWIEDLGSTNGIYVNEFLLEAEDGRRARKKLTYGDIIDLFSLRLIFCENFIQIDTFVGNVVVDGLSKIDPLNLSAVDNAPLLRMPPRKKMPLPEEGIKLPKPPAEAKASQDFSRILTYMARPLMWLLLPLAASAVGDTSSTGLNITRSAMYVIGPAMMVVNFVMQGRKRKKENQQKFEKYREKLFRKIHEIDKGKKTQNEIFRKTHTTSQDNIRRTTSLDWRLWERNVGDEDFMDIRIGIGQSKPSFPIEMPGEDSLDGKPEELVEELELNYQLHKDLNNYPITLDFKSNPNIGIVGVHNSRTKAWISMVVQMAVHHSSEDVRVALVFPEHQLNEVEMLRFLPHIWMEDRSGRMLFSGNNESEICDGKCLEGKGNKAGYTCPNCYRNESFNKLFNMVEEREKLYLDPDSNTTSFLPSYLFIITDVSLIKGKNTHDLCNYFLQDYSHLGIYTIILGEQRSDIPTTFKTIVSTGFEKGNLIDENGRPIRFHLDLYLRHDVDRIARALAPIQIENLAINKDIPSYVTLLDLFDATTVEDLKISENWEKQYDKPLPETPVGRLDQTKSLMLNISRKGIGPHGIVGGTTGSGKSEFLLSAILGMAIKCHPHRLGMVILDYKGGSTAEACKELPHVHGIVTDLDKGVMTRRALAAIKYEVEYREELFRKYSNSTGLRIEELVTYINTVKNGPVIPYLLVIVDELAELKIRETAAMEILEDIARRGRSVGIYLLLTTQNPQGVINSQIQANVNYKICFRISKDNSRGIIESPDAAYISDKMPGRGLIRVGSNELVAFQSAYTGAAYEPNKKKEDKISAVSFVFKVDFEGRRSVIYREEQQENSDEIKSQLNAVVEEVIKNSRRNKIEELSDLWLDPLPETLFLPYIIGKTNYIEGQGWQDESTVDLKIFVGLSDDIRNREYSPTIIDFKEEKSHLVIYGPSYSGKSTMLYTVMMYLAMQNSPKVLNMYLFDFSNTPNVSITKFPHIGNVFVGSNTEDVVEGRDLLVGEMTRRADLFGKSGVSNITEYNRVTKKEKLPHIFVFVDNIDVMSDFKSNVMQGFEELLRNGFSHGIYFVATAMERRALPYDFRRHFEAHTCCLLPQDVQNYETPRGFSMTARSQGRGYYKGFEFQCALPVWAENDESVNLKLSEVIEKMTALEGAYKVLKSDKVVSTFNIKDLGSIATEQSDTNIVIGYDINKREPAYFNLNRKNQLLISYIDIGIGRDRLASLYNAFVKSDLIKNKQTTVLTRDKAWIKKLKGQKSIKVIVFDASEKSANEIETFMLKLIKQANREETNQMIICDEWTELITISTQNTYEVMRYAFSEKKIESNMMFLLAGQAKGISIWSQKGCPHVVRPLKQYGLIVDGKIKEHEWNTNGVGDNQSVEPDKIICVENNTQTAIKIK